MLNVVRKTMLKESFKAKWESNPKRGETSYRNPDFTAATQIDGRQRI